MIGWLQINFHHPGFLMGTSIKYSATYNLPHQLLAVKLMPKFLMNNEQRETAAYFTEEGGLPHCALLILSVPSRFHSVGVAKTAIGEVH